MIRPVGPSGAVAPSHLTRRAMPGQYVVALRSSGARHAQPPRALVDKLALLGDATPLFSLPVKGTTLDLVELHTSKGPAAIRRHLGPGAQVAWIAPNYQYIGDPRERVSAAPNDPLYPKQYHHKLIGSEQAWGVTAGKAEIIVAVTDDGFDMKHEDFQGVFVKPKDFIDNDDDPSGGEHGTHVAGIIAAVANNGKGVAGVAPNIKVMPIRFYASGTPWTSTLIAKAYAYAVDNGARILSTSFNIDGFVNDPTFAAALDYVQSKGALHNNSAGNNGQKDPPRGKFDQLVLVAATDEQDKKASYSNYGKGIDIAAPGSKILSTKLGGGYVEMSGTSMSTPVMSAVEALIWSQHPEWSKEQVLARAMATADNLDAKNPPYKGMLGAGRVNAGRAVGEK